MLRTIHRWSMTSLLLVMAVMAMAETLHAQPQWTSSGLAATHVFSIASDSQGGMLAASQSGIYRSTDNGRTWTQTSLTSPAHTISVGRDGLAFASYYDAAGGGEALARSTDGGATWAPQIPLVRRSRGVTFDAEGAPIAIQGDSLFRSTDNGESWTPLGREGFSSSFFDFNQLAAGPNGDLMLGNWGITGGLVYISIDGGSSWQQIYNAGSDMSVLEITPEGTAFLAAHDRFVRSLDGGETWTAVPGVTTPPTQMAIAGNEIYILSDAIYRSTDEGSIWTRIAELPPLPANTRVTGLTVAADGELVAGTTKGIFRLSQTTSVRQGEISAGSLGIYPNPVNAMATIELPAAVRRDCHVELFDMLGQSRKVIGDSPAPGTRSITWNSGDLPSGIYLLRIDLDGASLSREIVVSR